MDKINAAKDLIKAARNAYDANPSVAAAYAWQTAEDALTTAKAEHDMSTNHTDPKEIAKVTINRIRWAYNRKTRTRKLVAVPYSGIATLSTFRSHAPTLNLFLEGPKGGMVWVTVLQSGQYDWTPVSRSGAPGRREVGHVYGPEIEMASIEMM